LQLAFHFYIEVRSAGSKFADENFDGMRSGLYVVAQPLNALVSLFAVFPKFSAERRLYVTELFGRDVWFHLSPKRLHFRPELSDFGGIDLNSLFAYCINRKIVTSKRGAFELKQLFKFADIFPE